MWGVYNSEPDRESEIMGDLTRKLIENLNNILPSDKVEAWVSIPNEFSHGMQIRIGVNIMKSDYYDNYQGNAIFSRGTESVRRAIIKGSKEYVEEWLTDEVNLEKISLSLQDFMYENINIMNCTNGVDYLSLTSTTLEENRNSITDEYGVRYTADGKKLISTPVSLTGEYKIKPGTESVCDSAFQYKVWLINVEIPSSVKYIGRAAFVHCERLMTARLPETLEYMGKMAFTACHLMNIIIPKTLKYIPDVAFGGNRELKSIILHNDIEYIGGSAFAECRAIEEFVFPPKVQVMSQQVLDGCWNLKKIVLPDGVVKIGNLAFSRTGIDDLVIPNSVKIMDKYVFDECRNLKEAKLPKGVYIVD